MFAPSLCGLKISLISAIDISQPRNSFASVAPAPTTNRSSGISRRSIICALQSGDPKGRLSWVRMDLTRLLPILDGLVCRPSPCFPSVRAPCAYVLLAGNGDIWPDWGAGGRVRSLRRSSRFGCLACRAPVRQLLSQRHYGTWILPGRSCNSLVLRRVHRFESLQEGRYTTVVSPHGCARDGKDC